ncbi:hypothetical protein CFO_g4311 [Ceratocystis platani]|uniref:Uncharacterized protein n=1 Tax=Ceratocystis fimbriata f. sp. platani TaxID=88771 RepID=A0A0F8BLP8_CERFI|nr:hypothetical protein CFO_g4311 [Ceratocystis platani]
MISPSSLLPAVLSFLGLYQNNFIENHGYELRTIDHLHMIRSPHLYDGREFVNAIGFTPEAKAATIYFANNELEQTHENKLSLAEIYITLCDKEGFQPGDMKWITFDVNADPETDGFITIIHKIRGIDPMDEVEILPGDMEWDLIARTEYFRVMQMITTESPEKILLRNYGYTNNLGDVFPTNCIYFSFSSDDTTSTTESGWPFDDEYQRDAVFLQELLNEAINNSEDSEDFEGSEVDQDSRESEDSEKNYETNSR